MAENHSSELHVLVMDDEPLVLTSLSLLLESLGHQVTQATRGEEVLDIVRNGAHCDIAILDMMVHGGLGAEAIGPILRQEFPQTKIVISSGFADDDVLNNPQDFGFDDRLLKPFGIKDLISLIERLAGGE